MFLNYFNNKKHLLRMARSKTKTNKKRKTISKKGRITRPNLTNNQLSYKNLLDQANKRDEPRRCMNILHALISWEIIKGASKVGNTNIYPHRLWKRTEDCASSIDLRTIQAAPPHFYDYLNYLYLMKVGPSISKLSKHLIQKQMEEEVAGQLMSMKES